MAVEDSIKAYTQLLIKQYYYKEKASAEIALYAKTFYDVYKFLDEFESEFDVDAAIGDRLDKIGKIVGIARIVPFVIPKVKFGFSNNPISKSFSSYFDNRESAQFFRAYESTRTSHQLDDESYRVFIKAKIALNNASAYMVSDERSSINNVIDSAFNGKAYVVDNKNMSLTLYIDPSITDQTLAIMQQLKLLPKPQGVRYSSTIKADTNNSFGFSNNPNSKGFSSYFNDRESGTFARKVFI